MSGLPKASITIEPGHLGIGTYDLDKFGHDDGSSRDPNDSFRLILELGAGYFTCLYVIGMGQPDGLGRFANFWFKSIVAVEVEMENYGAQELVEGAFELPVAFRGVTLVRGEEQTACYAVTGCSFEATTQQRSAPILTMRWRLANEAPQTSSPIAVCDAVLVWTNATVAGWTLSTQEGERALAAGEYVTFTEPVRIVR